MHFLQIDDLLNAEEIATLRQVAANGQFSDGRASNPHNTGKNNLQLHEPNAMRQTSPLILQALVRNQEFMDFAFPKRIAPPLVSKYEPGMAYDAHSDTAFINAGKEIIRTDLSITIFLGDPDEYEGGALKIEMGAGTCEFRLPPGCAVLYPSDTLHRVTPVTRGARLAAITFIESFIPDTKKREMLWELNELVAEEGLKMSPETHARFQHVQDGLRRMFSDAAPGGS
ncbi:Fe2+-dependent dioxygenase [Pacificimonas flava]|uniref:Fe2+-dependent dioxygenase n=2 Tax=Pacificimonas TaxID=1960290 RepID=A0A219B8E4_9SPHN|nr:MULTISPECIES: Fe2+-dependent dioxygenase [Pacificimonas]MBZ6379877.1 Fe2+-dependent dioxygenase [Pacificimonas aurantium]OWV34406.1 Fe2+-dependent dioxygenase [Pacificimonas flava]